MRCICMFVFNRKRISVMLLIILIGIFAFSYKTSEKEIKKDQKYVTTTPVANKVIILDAGHGVPDEGDCLLTLIDNN